MVGKRKIQNVTCGTELTAFNFIQYHIDLRSFLPRKTSIPCFSGLEHQVSSFFLNEIFPSMVTSLENA